MKQITIAAALAAFTLAGGAASAADIPRKSPPPATFVQPVPIFTWTGFYVGLSGGYAFENGKSTINGSPALLATGLVPGATKTLGDGFLIGGTLGYNYQIGNFVAGLETDLSYIDLGKTSTTTFGGLTTTLSQNSTYFGTVRGRLGVTFDRLLVYATGGLAYGDQDATTGLTGLGGVWAGGKSSTRFGYTLGAGMEYALDRNWSAKIEYLYYDLGKAEYTSPQVAGAAIPGVFATTRADMKGNIVRAGVNYRF